MLVREVQVPTDGRHYVPTSPRGHSRHLQHHGLVTANVMAWSGPTSHPGQGQCHGPVTANITARSGPKSWPGRCQRHGPVTANVRVNITPRSGPTSRPGHRTCQGDSSELALSTRGISNLFLTREESAQVLLT